MEFEKPKREDMPVVIITAIAVLVLMVSSATSKSEETGEPLTFAQWLIVNIFIIAIAFVVDIVLIKKREKRREENRITKEKEKARRERAEKEMTVAVNIKSGAIGMTGICQMRQLFENNLFYFNDEFEALYEMVGYEWGGAKYKKITKTSSQGADIGKTKASGIAGGGFGAIAGAGNVRGVTNRSEVGEMVEKEVEEQGSAIIRMKRCQDERTVSFIIECDSEMDKKIRCFNNVPE